MKRILPLTILFVGSLVGLMRYQFPPCSESADATLQSEWQGSFDIRIDRLPESCAFMAATAGANYVVLSKQVNSTNWQEIDNIHYDDPIEVPNDSIRFLNENTAYVFFINEYLITTDRGLTWSQWKVENDLADWKRPGERYPNWAIIEKVDLSLDGSGRMFLNRIGDGKGLVRKLRTDNFGKTWSPEE